MAATGKKPIFGWDLGLGGGREAPALPGKIHEAVLFPAVSAGGDLPPSRIRTVNVDVWGLDPKVVVVADFHQRLRPDGAFQSEPPLSASGFEGSIVACSIARTDSIREPVREGPVLDSSKWFANGGTIAGGVGDVCSISEALQGVRFKVSGQRLSGGLDHDVVVAIVARTGNALQCQELAEAIVAQLQVKIDPPADLTT